MSEDGPFSNDLLREEALRAARGLSDADGALVAVLRDLEFERERAGETSRSVVRALAATLQARDGYTGDHSDEVQMLALAVGARLGLDRRALQDLGTIALLHDVGKIGIPDHVLHKTGPLDDDDWVLMREHPVIGERILASVPGLERVAHAVRHEHERFDGEGYPDGLAGQDIPLASRIVLACDAWHALVSDRPYRRALDREAAIAELEKYSGTQFDPQVIDALLTELATPRGVSAPAEVALPGPRGAIESEVVALLAVASAVAAAQSVDDVLEMAAERALEALDASSLSIERWVPEREALRTLINVGDLGPGETRYPSDEFYTLTDDPDLWGLLREQRPYAVSLEDPSLSPCQREILLSFDKHSCCAVPISFGGTVWGQIWASRSVDRPLFNEREVRFLAAISGQLAAAIGRAEIFSHVSEMAHSDALTGLANRRAFDEALEFALIEARSEQRDVALVLVDVDNLKEINDSGGHEAGDAALQAVARTLTDLAESRDGALVCRIGGDEFCVLLRDADLRGAQDLAEQAIDAAGLLRPKVGMSCGVAALAEGIGRPGDLLRAADAAQYAAKRAGRGCVFVADGSGEVAAAERAMRRRAFRGAEAVDVGQLVVATLAQLDGPRAGTAGGERLATVTRRCSEAADGVGWNVALAAHGAEPEVLSVGGRPGALSSMLRRRSWLQRSDMAALSLAAGTGRGTLIDPRTGNVSAAITEHLLELGIATLLAFQIDGPYGTWLVEIAADARTRDLAGVESALRLLAPEALRVAAAAAAEVG